jgi:multidrug efflux pump subunit AcrB
VASLRPDWQTASIYRRDGQRTLSVLAYPEFGSTAADVSKRFLPGLRALGASLPAGYTLELGGENEQRREAETNLAKNAVYGLLIVLMLVMAEFRSLRLTGLIGGVVVCSVSGGLLALWLTRWPLNFMAMMGMAMHAGVADNDATVLIDGLERRRRAGEPLVDLVLDGTRERIRHVIITSTSIGGYLPMALSSSLLWPPLAIVMIGGLAFSTILTLVVVPAAYLLLQQRREAAQSGVALAR